MKSPSQATPATRTEEGVAGLRQERRNLLSYLQPARFSGVYLILLFLLIFAFWVPDTFFTSATLKGILSQESITAIAAIGILFPLAVGKYDLSVANMLGLGAMLTAWLNVEHHMGAVEVILIVLGIGFLVGLINATLVVLAGVDSFIATLGMSSILLAVDYKISDGQFVSGIHGSLVNLASPQPLGIPILAFYLVAIALVAWYVLEHTPIGRRMHATGANDEAARLAGVATARLGFSALVISSVVASFAGVLLASKLKSASTELGAPYLLPVFAAALLGTTQVNPGRVNVAGTIVAFVLLAVGIKGLQLAGAEIWVTQLFNGVALLVAVTAASLGRKGVGRRWVRMRRAGQVSRSGPPSTNGATPEQP